MLQTLLHERIFILFYFIFLFRQIEYTSPQDAARIFEGKREKLAGFCSKLHKGLLLILRFIKHRIIRVVKGLRWAELLARMREMRNAWCTECYLANLVYRSDILALILRRSRTGTVWFYTSTGNKRAARPKLYTKSLTRDLKLMYSRLTLVRISINL